MAFQRKKPAAIGIKAPYPGFIEPALATSIDKVPSGGRWIHEVISAEIISQSAEPLIGEMTLTTDLGDVVLVVNKEAAELLIEELTAFLDAQ